jgi:hypothetical protein
LGGAVLFAEAGPVAFGDVAADSSAIVSAETADASTSSDGVDEAKEIRPAVAPAAAPAAGAAPVNGRVFGVLPNYRTADGSLPFSPITTKRKLTIARKDSLDYPLLGVSAVFTSVYQLQNQNPEFGQGMKGYGKRFAAAWADQAIGNFMTEGLFPSMLHQDPRYFRLGAGNGSAKRRLWYAATRVMLTKTDRGNWTFNSSEWLGNAAAAAISNAYYPESTRNAVDNTQKLVVQVGTDALSNVFKEFWPDWKRKFFTKKK